MTVARLAPPLAASTAHRTPVAVWYLVAAVALWSPLFHLVKWAWTPDGFVYTWVNGNDAAGWIAAIDSPHHGYLSARDLGKDVNVFYRLDMMAVLYVPYGLLGKLLGIPSAAVLILIETLWNGLCAYAAYRFFKTFLGEERVAVSALILCYGTSGITGVWLVLHWLWNAALFGAWSAPLLPAGWAGENHAMSYEFFEGNALVNLTILNRPNYAIARFFGLYAMILSKLAADRTGESPVKKIRWATLWMALCTYFHPATGMIFCLMLLIFVAMELLRPDTPLDPAEDAKAKKNIRSPFQYRLTLLMPLLGFLAAAVVWQLYKLIPDAADSIKEYVKQLYNADALLMLTGTLPLLGVGLLLLLHATKERTLFALLILSSLAATAGLSEWIIRDNRIWLRALWLSAAALLFIGASVWKRRYLLNRLTATDDARTATLFGLWLWVMMLFSVSPHHDILKVVRTGEAQFGALTGIIEKALEAGNLIYAARFKLGVAVPLAGFTAWWIYRSRLSQPAPHVWIAAALILSMPSALIYIGSVATGRVGYISHDVEDGFTFLRGQPKLNVMCAGETGIYIVNSAKKRALIGGACGVIEYETRVKEVEQFYTATDSLRQRLIETHHIDYIFFGDAERRLSGGANPVAAYPVLYTSGSVSIYSAVRPSQPATTKRTESDGLKKTVQEIRKPERDVLKESLQ